MGRIPTMEEQLQNTKGHVMPNQDEVKRAEKEALLLPWTTENPDDPWSAASAAYGDEWTVEVRRLDDAWNIRCSRKSC